MRLVAARVIGVGPFEDVRFPFADEAGTPNRVSVVHGGGGVGKTTLLTAIASTRPGHSVVLPASLTGDAPLPERPVLAGESRVPCAICEWSLGADDPGRPHPIVVATPSVRALAHDELEGLRRREQAIFDRRARGGGFAFLALSSGRWFSRQPIAMSAPARTVARYDVRASAVLDDAARADLARETKQALSYAEIASALEASRGTSARFGRLRDAMRGAVQALVQMSGYSFLGLDAASFEPIFRSASGKHSDFDALPTHVRHLVALAALPVRTLWAAYPGIDPREAEGVVLVDEIDLHQDAITQAGLARALTAALPGVQWILTTSSPVVAASCDAGEALALRRLPDAESVDLYVGHEARTH